MRFPFCRNRDSVKNGILISIRRTGDGFYPGLFNLDIKDNEKKQLSKLIFNKQNIILVLIAILFSPVVIGVRFIYCKIDKIENRKTKTIIKIISFVVFSLYLISLKENVAYLLIGIFSLVYLLYQFYLSGLETKWFVSASLRQAIIHEIPV